MSTETDRIAQVWPGWRTEELIGRGGFGRNGFGRNGGDTDGTTEPGSADGLENGQPAPGDRGFGGGKRRGR